MTDTIILEPSRVTQKLQRMALEILERTAGAPGVLIAGIEPGGFVLAGLIGAYLEEFSGRKFPVYSVKLDKKTPLSRPVETDIPTELLNDTVLILVDDVQNSGKTMMYAIRHFLQFPLRAVQTCVLVDRRHNSFPVRADYVGLSLSTTLQEHVTVKTAGGQVEVLLG